MDYRKEFKALFPMEVKVTRVMLSNANRSDIYNCIGAKALNKGLGKTGRSLLANDGKIKASWGDCTGEQILKDNKMVVVGAYYEGKNVSMMDLTEPTIITLKIEN